jgi:hypothetical protein
MKRPGGMTFVAVLDVLFGCFGGGLALLGMLAALLGARNAVIVEGAMGIPGVTADQQHLVLEVMAFSLFGLAVGGLAILAGIALFAMWRWARRLNLAYAYLGALRSVIWFLFPITTATSAPPQAWMRIASLCLGLAYPTALFILFRKPGWKAAFARSYPTTSPQERA